MHFEVGAEDLLQHLIPLTFSGIIDFGVIEPLAEALNWLVNLGIDNILKIGL